MADVTNIEELPGKVARIERKLDRFIDSYNGPPQRRSPRRLPKKR